jgi:putative endonuclease
MGGWTYIMTNKPRGVLYLGVAADLGQRVYAHKTGAGSDFCRRYGLNRLVWNLRHDRIEEAIDHEKRLKKWRRDWKIKLIEEMNPDWRDLYETLNG